MDFLCCSERWTCPWRPWFPLLNLYHIGHLGCFRSLWPKWNYLLLKPRLGKEPTCDLNFHFLSGNVDFLWRGSGKETDILQGGLIRPLMSSQFLYTKCPEGIRNSMCTGVEYIQRCFLAVCRPEWWITKEGARKKKKWMQGCKYKHLVFRRANTKAAPFMITQRSTMQSSSWQQLMQMCAVQRCSAQLNPPCSASRSHWHKLPVADEMLKSRRPRCSKPYRSPTWPLMDWTCTHLSSLCHSRENKGLLLPRFRSL